MDILLRTIGTHRGAPRLYLDSYALLRAGFTPGMAFRVSGDPDRQQLTIAIDAGGDRHVSRKTSSKTARKATCDAPVPVIDLNSAQTLASLSGLQQVRIVIRVGTIHVLALASHRKAAARAQRLQQRLHDALPLRCASVAFAPASPPGPCMGG